jgi:hypothetical protein
VKINLPGSQSEIPTDAVEIFNGVKPYMSMNWIFGVMTQWRLSPLHRIEISSTAKFKIDVNAPNIFGLSELWQSGQPLPNILRTFATSPI